MIKLSNVNKIFNIDTPISVAALRDINLTVAGGEYIVVVGSNGSGKTTLLNCVAGTTAVTSGEILINDNSITHLKDYNRSKWIARIFQNPLQGTASDLSVLDNFRLAALRTQKKNFTIGTTQTFRNRVAEKIKLLGLGLEDKLNQKMGTLSGGQRQACTLLMAVMDKAEILLMDEPTAALDPKSSVMVMQIADRLIKEFNLTAILITHNLKEAQLYGTRILQMQEGKIAKDISSTEKKNLTANEMVEWFG